MTQEVKTYNGWKNYETWVTKLWMDNDEAGQNLQREWVGTAKNTPKNEVWTREETTRFTLADLMKEYVEDNSPLEGDASMYTDLLKAAMSEVNWEEIAGNILES